MWRTRRVVAVGCAVRGVGPQPAGLAAPLTTCRADWRDAKMRYSSRDERRSDICTDHQGRAEHGREVPINTITRFTDHTSRLSRARPGCMKRWVDACKAAWT